MDQAAGVPTDFARRAGWPRHLVIAGLLLVTVVTLAPRLGTGLSTHDTHHLETPLVLASARQLTEGWGRLYGPIDGDHPWVLIHAPLYYRMTALSATPLTWLGIDPVDATLIAGRSISLLGLLALLAAVYALAGSNPKAAGAGVLTALMVSGCSLLDTYPVTVRADILGLAFQTVGIMLIARGTRLEDTTAPRTGAWLAAYAMFALAVATKQHLIAGLAVTSILSSIQAARRLFPLRLWLASHAVLALVLGGLLGAEFWLTDGAVINAVVFTPGELSSIQSASWSQVTAVLVESAKRMIGLLALAGICLLPRPSSLISNRFEWYLTAILAMELLLLLPLCRGNQGAWTNYALPAMVIGGVLVGRALARLLNSSRPLWTLPPILAVLAIMLVFAVRLTMHQVQFLRADRADLMRLIDDPTLPIRTPDEVYFANAPEHTRVFGRRKLAHDEWLYGAMESLESAEPRSLWLKQALTGPVKRVIAPYEAALVPGVTEPLTDLGYRHIASSGRYRLYERR